MRLIELQAIPNQAFSIRLNGISYDFIIKETAGVMCATISRDSVKLLDSVRITAGEPLIPYRYLEDDQGNFALVGNDGDLINYARFGITQFLVYVTPSELLTLRGDDG